MKNLTYFSIGKEYLGDFCVVGKFAFYVLAN